MPLGTNYTYTSVSAGTGDEAGVAAAFGLHLMGYSIRETAAAAATVNIEHGAAGSSPVMDAVNLAASTSASRWFGPGGLPCFNGVFIERLTGTTEVHLITTVK